MTTQLSYEASELAGSIEVWIDTYIDNLVNNEYNKKRRLLNLLRVTKVKKSDCKTLVRSFYRFRDELDLVLEQNDVDLLEGYDFLTISKVQKLRNFVSDICADLETYSKITKKKKKKTPDQVLKSFQHLASTTINKIFVQSFEPDKILDKKCFIAFNVKTGDAFYYETQESFSVKGTTLINFDPELSFCIKASRNADKLITKCSSSGFADAKREIEKIKTKRRVPTGRFNKHTLLLKAPL